MKNRKEKTKKQIYTKFFIMVLVGSVGGFLIGVGGAFLTDMYEGDLFGGLMQVLRIVVPALYILSMVLVYGYSFMNFTKAKKLAIHWDGWNEEVIDEADKKLTRAMEPCNIMMVCNFFLYTAMVYVSGIHVKDMEKTAFEEGLPYFVAGIVLFFFNTIVLTIFQKISIDLAKKMNPEKKGNIFDTEFNKDWLASCDEAEKKMIYEASYSAYRATSTACMVMWLVTLVEMLLFDTGMLASACVFVLWLTLVLSYTIACRKLR